MALDISKEVEQQVLADRAEGMSLDALVEKYKEHGVTKNWVRRVCKDIKVVKMATSPQKAIAAILPLATRPVGVKPSEYFPLLKECYGVVWDEEEQRDRLNMNNAQRSYMRAQVKEKAKAIGKVAAFIPEWLDRTDPAFCNQMMLACAQSLYDSFEEQVNYFLSEFPELGEGKGKGYSIRNELFSLVVKGYDPSGVHKRCERNKASVDFLTGNADIPLKTKKPKKKEDGYFTPDHIQPVETKTSLDEWDEILTDLGY